MHRVRRASSSGLVSGFGVGVGEGVAAAIAGLGSRVMRSIAYPAIDPTARQLKPIDK